MSAIALYSADEFETPRNMGAVMHVEASPELLAVADAAAANGMASYQAFWSGADKESRKLLAGGHEGRKTTAAGADGSRTVENTPPAPPDADVVLFTFAQVMDRLVKAKDADALAIASDLIGEIADPAQRAELVTKFKSLTAEMTGGAA